LTKAAEEADEAEGQMDDEEYKWLWRKRAGMKAWGIERMNMS
jgi:hypothetical protein